ARVSHAEVDSRAASWPRSFARMRLVSRLVTTNCRFRPRELAIAETYLSLLNRATQSFERRLKRGVGQFGTKIAVCASLKPFRRPISLLGRPLFALQLRARSRAHSRQRRGLALPC